MCTVACGINSFYHVSILASKAEHANYGSVSLGLIFNYICRVPSTEGITFTTVSIHIKVGIGITTELSNLHRDTSKVHFGYRVQKNNDMAGNKWCRVPIRKFGNEYFFIVQWLNRHPINILLKLIEIRLKIHTHRYSPYDSKQTQYLKILYAFVHGI